jgi:hypothetical protein
MPAPNRDRWTEWRQIARERIEVARHGLREWADACREEPVLIWQTPAVRYTVYSIGALVIILILRGAVGLLEPKGVSHQPRAATANFDVICDNAECQHTFAIQRKFKFRKFPVTCPHCNERTGQRALRCPSESCRGRLARTIKKDDGWYCAECQELIARRN